MLISLQGYGALWKGCGSTYVVCAVNFFSEAAISSLTHLPQYVTQQNTSLFCQISTIYNKA